MCMADSNVYNCRFPFSFGGTNVEAHRMVSSAARARGGVSGKLSGSLLDFLHRDGEGHPWEAGSEELLDLSEQ